LSEIYHNYKIRTICFPKTYNHTEIINHKNEFVIFNFFFFFLKLNVLIKYY